MLQYFWHLLTLKLNETLDYIYTVIGFPQHACTVRTLKLAVISNWNIFGEQEGINTYRQVKR
jgi:hypothetical protein